MALAKNEKLIKDWNYATQSGRGVSVKQSLIVTNKRLVHELRSSTDITRQEVPLSNVKALNMSSAKRISIPAIIAIVFGVLLAIAGVALKFVLEADMVVMVPFLAIGVILVVVGILCLKRASFTLEIITNGCASIYGGSSNIVSKKDAKVTVKINISIANEIIETLGAILLDNANGTSEEEEA